MSDYVSRLRDYGLTDLQLLSVLADIHAALDDAYTTGRREERWRTKQAAELLREAVNKVVELRAEREDRSESAIRRYSPFVNEVHTFLNSLPEEEDVSERKWVIVQSDSAKVVCEGTINTEVLEMVGGFYAQVTAREPTADEERLLAKYDRYVLEKLRHAPAVRWEEIEGAGTR
jgi:hypothetical protein